MIFFDLLKKLHNLSPLEYALEYDNTGFQIGYNDKEIKKICLATDATLNVVEQAITGEADLLLTHHPLIFEPLKQITSEDIIGRRIIKLIRSDINYLAMHTNFDVIGMADYAAEIMNLTDPQVLYVTCRNAEKDEGIGRYGGLETPVILKECAQNLKQLFNLDTVRVYGDSTKIIRTVAISPGSSGGVLPHALKAKADLLITGDIKHSMAVEANAHGIALIDAGHHALEKIFVPFMNHYFTRETPEIEVFAANEPNPFYTI
ncbi:MAG: Nif3-like dinuclear metal center hexameric protein [Lachnospiraceae bacterium]|nr:Nif3-like dinuclear metal center hexameric protein [Lachnospiraceae bacterium]